jgi:xylulokinase
MAGQARLVAGVDSLTQATKVVVRQADTGVLVGQGRASHPEGTEVDPAAWEQALEAATAGGLLDEVAAVSVGAQQHGMVCVDQAGQVVCPALLWNDTRSARGGRRPDRRAGRTAGLGRGDRARCRWPASP